MPAQDVELFIPGAPAPWRISKAYTSDGDYGSVNAINEGIALTGQNMINKWLDLNTMSEKVTQDSAKLQQINDLMVSMKTWDGSVMPSSADLAALATAGFIPTGQLWVNLKDNPVNPDIVDVSTIRKVPANYQPGDTLNLGAVYQRPDGSLFYTFPTSAVSYTPLEVTLDSSTLLQRPDAAISAPADAAFIAQLVPNWTENGSTLSKNLTQVSQTNQTVLQQMMAKYEQWSQLLTSLITRKEKVGMDLAKNIA